MKSTKFVSKSDTKPNAWVVNPTDRGRKSVKSDNKIYLQDGQEFQIELYNPLTESVLSDIRVNGKSVSESGLVLRPGERFYLDCFVDDKKKFIFKTYEVEDTEESKKSISNNGTVEVFFYKENTLSFKDWFKRYDRVIERHYYPRWYPWYQPYTTYPTYTTLGGSNLYNNSVRNDIYQNGLNNLDCSYTSNSIVNLSSDSLTSGVTYYSDNNIASNIETGRVEKGSISTQEFIEIDMEFQKYHISSVLYQILPESQKPLETKEVKKVRLNDILKRDSDDIIELIRKLGDLHVAGILTDEEFNSKKSELLSKI